MIYDKPRDINLRVFPSFYSLVQDRKKRRKAAVKTEAEPETRAPEKVIADNKSIIDINEMPIIDGIPMLKFGSLPVEAQKKEKPEAQTEISFDVSAIPDIEGIPLLILPDKPTVKEPTLPSPPPVKELPKQKKKKAPPVKEKAVRVKAKKKEPINKKYVIKVASFLLMLYVGTALAFAIPLRPAYSETEKRELEKFPEFSSEALLEGNYFDQIGTWFSDTFPFREALTKANTYLKSLYGFDSIVIHGDVDTGDEIPDLPQATEPVTAEPETNVPVTEEPTTEAVKPDIKTESLGAIIVAGDSAYEYYGFSEELAPRFINSVNSIKGSSNIKGEIYSMIIPTSIDITLYDAVRADVKSADQKKALEYFNNALTNTTAVTGIYEAERLHRDEYTYFRTDHHWTALGAYYAYEQFAITKGIAPVPLTDYETVTFDGFLGSFYSQSGQSPSLGKTPDFVTAYLPFNNADCTIVETDGDEFEWDIVSDVSTHSANLKYLTFIGGDNALTTIRNNDNPDGGTCIVIKESYGNAFVPFLVPHYGTIYVIDPRHYDGTLSEFTADKEIDDIIFISNISTTRNRVYIEAMEEFIR